MAQQRAQPNVWPGVLLFLSGAATASAQILGIVAGDATTERWFLLAVSVLMALSGLGLLSFALRARRRAR